MGNRTGNLVQVQNISGVGGASRVTVGGANRPMGVARSTSLQAVRTSAAGD